MHPAVLTESEVLVGHIAEMLDGIRNSAHGLADEQARSTPCRSELSISGIVKHCTWVMSAQTGGRESEPGSTEGAAEFMGSFRPTPDETIDVLLERFDTVRDTYIESMRALDPAAEMIAAPQPWEGILTESRQSTRLLLAHHIDEFARHAGHADIIREQLDGADAMALRFAAEGREGNAYVQPWSPS
ncbi:DinB family protein [Mariniluteicoccus endophyticus]